MGTEIFRTYRCNVCWNTVDVIHAGVGTLVCCGKPMDLLVENANQAEREKHVPRVERIDGGSRVTVGAAPHPMEKNHHIEWIEVADGGLVCRQFLAPGEAPRAFLPLGKEKLAVRAYCNLHGLWRGE